MHIRAKFLLMLSSKFFCSSTDVLPSLWFFGIIWVKSLLQNRSMRSKPSTAFEAPAVLFDTVLATAMKELSGVFPVCCVCGKVVYFGLCQTFQSQTIVPEEAPVLSHSCLEWPHSVSVALSSMFVCLCSLPATLPAVTRVVWKSVKCRLNSKQ